MTSAPQSASWRAQVGPARTRVRSSTVKRVSALDARGRPTVQTPFSFSAKLPKRLQNLVDPSVVVYRPRRLPAIAAQHALLRCPCVAILRALWHTLRPAIVVERTAIERER